MFQCYENLLINKSSVSSLFQSLTELNLNSNQLDDEAALLLAGALKENTVTTCSSKNQDLRP